MWSSLYMIISVVTFYKCLYSGWIFIFFKPNCCVTVIKFSGAVYSAFFEGVSSVGELYRFDVKFSDSFKAVSLSFVL